MNESRGLLGSLPKGVHVLGSILIGLGILVAIMPAFSGDAVNYAHRLRI